MAPAPELPPTSSEASANALRLQFAIRVHEYNSEQNALADAKAGVCVVLCGAFLNLLYEEFWKDMTVCSCVNLFSLVPFVLFVVSGFYLYKTIFPRFNSIRPKGLLFWKFVGVQHATPQEYGEKIAKLDEEQCIMEVACNNHEISDICKAKFGSLDIGMRFCFAGVACTMLLILIAKLLLLR
jgi:hypothetical protein